MLTEQDKEDIAEDYTAHGGRITLKRFIIGTPPYSTLRTDCRVFVRELDLKYNYGAKCPGGRAKPGEER